MFLDMLKTQLLLKNVIAAEDWDPISQNIFSSITFMIIILQN